MYTHAHTEYDVIEKHTVCIKPSQTIDSHVQMKCYTLLIIIPHGVINTIIITVMITGAGEVHGGGDYYFFFILVLSVFEPERR